MGFFSNLKNAVTGGAATVQVHAPVAQRGGVVPIHVEAIAKADGQVNAVYLLVRAIEHAEVKDTDYVEGEKRTETVRGRKVSFETRVQIAGAAQLQNGQSYHWEGQLQLPPTVNPSFQGHMIRHLWEIQAGLDMKGNDPDSGWQPLEVV